MDPVKLYQGPRMGNVPNASPFCTKVELFLRIMDVPYELGAFNPQKAPRGKMPYIRIGEQWVADSERILDHLEQVTGRKLDEHLSPDQKNMSHMMRRMLEEATYFIVLADRWLDPANWNHVKSVYFGSMPPVVRSLVPGMLRKGVRRTCKGQGVTRYPGDELVRMLNRDLAAVDHFMTNGPFYFGERPSRLDCTVYAFLAGLIATKTPNRIQTNYYDHKKFREYVTSISKKYFPDLGDPFAG